MAARDRRDSEQRLARIAARQYGLVTRGQAREAGLSDRAIRHRVATSRWLRVYAGVYLVAGTPRSYEQEVLAACLAVGGEVAASHITAGVLWGLIERRRPPVELTVPERRRATGDRFAVARSRQPLEAVTRTDGIPVTSVRRTLLDLASRLDHAELEEALEVALRRYLVRLDELRDWLEEMPRRRPGRRALAAIVREQGSARPAGSVKERQVLRMLRRDGLPEPVRQHEVRRGGRVIARPDLAYPDQRIAIEYDSREWHSSRSAYEADKARTFELQRAGWVVLPLTEADFGREDVVCRGIRRLLWERGHPAVASPDPP